MKYGICNLGIVALRLTPSNKSEMVSQLLFGEYFEIVEKQQEWLYISCYYDGYKGWIDKKQLTEIHDDVPPYDLINAEPYLVHNLVDFITEDNQKCLPVTIGASLPFYKKGILNLFSKQYHFDGEVIQGKYPKENLLKTAFLLLNAPYLWGGRTPFGIDCSGFTQLVYKLNGYKLLRNASQQATQGETLSFIEESDAGDLAFFDNEDGLITHVGIIMTNNYIIHAHGKVRIDMLDQSGIFNLDTKRHTHKLRLIKKIVT